MIQEKCFSVEHLKDGSIGKVVEVEAKGRNGSIIRYYMARDAADACSQAKDWYARRLAVVRGAGKRLEERKRREGKCCDCELPAEPGKRRCARHRSIKNANAKRQRQGLASPPRRLTPEQRHQNELGSKRMRGYVQVSVIAALKKFDELGPVAFRSWLVSKIPATRAQEPGMVGPLRTKKDRIDWFESSLEKSMWHPPMAVDEPMAQAAE